MSLFTATTDGVRVSVRAVPKAARARIDGPEATADGGTRLKVRVTAPADRGKANEAVLRLLAKAWGVAPRDLTLVSGTTARNKQVLLAGDPAAQLERLTKWLKDEFHER